MRRRRPLPPKPPEPPEGMMWLYWDLVAIEEAEQRAKQIMKGFDKLPRKERDKQNYREPLPRPIRQTSKSVKRWCAK